MSHFFGFRILSHIRIKYTYFQNYAKKISSLSIGAFFPIRFIYRTALRGGFALTQFKDPIKTVLERVYCLRHIPPWASTFSTLAIGKIRFMRERDSFRAKKAVLKIELLGKGLTQEINGDRGSYWWAPEQIYTSTMQFKIRFLHAKFLCPSRILRRIGCFYKQCRQEE